MEDSLITIISICLVAVLMFIFPLMSISTRNDDISQVDIQTETIQFVDNIRTTGKITLDNYDNFIQTLSSTGNTYDVEIIARILDENPSKKGAQTEITKIGENIYYSEYTAQIEEKLYANNEMQLKEGDIILVNVKNTNTTIAQMLQNFFYAISGNSTYSVEASHSGLVMSGKNIITNKDDTNSDKDDTENNNKGDSNSKDENEDILDKSKPIILNVVYTSNNAIITAIDEGKGVAGHRITTNSNKPESFIKCTVQNELSVTVGELEQNKQYYAWVIDAAGNVSDSYVFTTSKVDNSTQETIQFKVAPEEWTNQDVIVTASQVEQNLHYSIQTSFNEEFSSNEVQGNSITVTKNQRIYARIVDSTKQSNGYTYVDVTNIDKIEPVITNLVATTNSIIITATDDISGIIGYQVTTTNDVPNEFIECNNTKELQKKVSNLSQNTNYYVWVKDAAGNISCANNSIYTDSVESISNIEYTCTPSYITKENVEIKLSGNTTNYTLQYKTEKVGQQGEVSNWTIYEEPIILTRNQSVYLRLADSTGQSSGLEKTIEIRNIDKLAPNTFTPTIRTSRTTMTIVANTRDQETSDYISSGIDGYRFSIDDGKTWTEYQNSGNYTFSGLTQGKEYKIKIQARDNAGNIVTVTNKKEVDIATISFEYSPQNIMTNGDTKLTISTNNSKYTIQYKTAKTGKTGEVSDWTNYTSPITLTRNQAVYARLVDSNGSDIGINATANISNIDKLAPNELKIISNTSVNTITIITEATDQDKTSDYEKSGIQYYRYSKDNGKTWTEWITESSYSFTKLTAGTTYQIKVQVQDKAGNTTEGSSSIKTIPTYTITFDPNGGNVSQNSISKATNEIYGALPIATRTGYSFLGWYTAKNGGQEITGNTVFDKAENQTLYAKWQAETYLVIFAPNGGNVTTGNKTVTYDNTYGTLPTPTRTGYTFLGWYTSAVDGQEITSGTKVQISSNQVLYAMWKLNSYTITFDANGDTDCK